MQQQQYEIYETKMLYANWPLITATTTIVVCPIRVLF